MTLVVGLIALPGCAGGGRMELSALNYRAIDPPAARAYPLDFDHCYWWTDDSERVWVAMDCVRRPLVGPLGPFVYQMSLVLEKLPAGRARDYAVREPTLRAVSRFGPLESRFVAPVGIVSLNRQPGERLRGSFRLLAQREVSQVLGGFGAPASYLLQGTFQAVHDAQRGQPIVAATESQGWGRQSAPVPTTRSSTVQPAPHAAFWSDRTSSTTSSWVTADDAVPSDAADTR